MGHYPAGASVQSIVHYGQMMNAGEMPLFDYGKVGNNKKYGQEHPPKVDISKINVPTAMFVGKFDDLGDVTDA